MWSTQNEKFHTLSQSFALFPDEFQWTDYDGIILGDVTYDGNLKGRKPRGLKYVIIPPANINTEEAMDDYYKKIDQLVEFLNKNVAEKGEPMLINKDRSIFPAVESSDRIATLWYRQTSREIGVMRKMLRGARHDNPNWLYLKYDRNLYSFRAFHFHLEWFICDSWEVDKFVSSLFRQCTKQGLRLCQSNSSVTFQTPATTSSNASLTASNTITNSAAQLNAANAAGAILMGGPSSKMGPRKAPPQIYGAGVAGKLTDGRFMMTRGKFY